MGLCCPFLSGGVGHPPYLLWGFVIFCIVGIVKLIQKLDTLIKLLEKK